MVHHLDVYYGSETGTAQEVAEYVAAMAGRRGFDTAAASLDSVPISHAVECSLAVFVVSTTGDGEVPSNMSTFWRFLLRRGLPKDCLANMCFAIFGLGDSGYTKYNATARKLHARLLQLGAVELVERGLGDDQSPRGMWGDLDPWLASLWAGLLQIKPLPEGTVVDDTPRLEPPVFSMTPAEASDSSSAEIEAGRREFWDSMAPPRPATRSDGAPAPARLLVNRRLTAEGHFQDVRHLEFDASGVPGGASYEAGDVAWVHPSNNASAVETLAVAMGLDLDQVVRIAPALPQPKPVATDAPVAREEGGAVAEGTQPPGAGVSATAPVRPRRQQRRDPQQAGFFLPPVSTLRLLLTEVLDISGTPRRSFFERLSVFATEDEEKEKLEELASPAGADLLYEYATREKRGYVEVFGDFPSCKVPPERLLELVPRLRPRGFSIASSALETPSQVHLCMAVVSFRTPYKRLRTGVCSSWLASLTPGAAEVPISIRPGTFKLPQSPSHPLIMVGPGTGVAPMRSVVLERWRQRQQGLGGAGVGSSGDGSLWPSPGRPGTGATGAPPDTLFFGCRFREKDFFYEQDWEVLSASGNLSLFTAFSRSNPDGTGSRVYVQHRIREQASLIAGLVVDHGANILVSGSAKQMPRDVREAFRDVLAEHEKVGGEAGADSLLKAMDRQGRYCVEAWS
ncbi:conserved unknown protein [Ectocarpus siliculosus]|uniref:NADPH-dependent diflavin oxidoreductase 1 n=1 Tax=Ectocarpus siliculosus TaxID=2880 RepID=D7FGS7_ECTSI|nr:conserved unknown protein [Ectocarpus siliculosus]|eukprot:CBJ28353.1 conserved unknown protein [Ectocarpus siliculosus]